MDRAREQAYLQAMTLPPIHAELEAYVAAAQEIEQLLTGDADVLARPVVGVSRWSPLQHAAHVTLANELVLRNLVNLSRGSGMLVVTEAVQIPRALEILERGTLPRGEAQAPRMVVPPNDIDVHTAREWAAKFVVDLNATRASLDVERLPLCFIPHQVLGPLTLAQWARFGTTHTRHHLAIATSSPC